jgi:hypothetical protein
MLFLHPLILSTDNQQYSSFLGSNQYQGGRWHMILVNVLINLGLVNQYDYGETCLRQEQ